MTIAVVFPGQGSQRIGMLAELADVYPVVRQTFNEAADRVGIDLWSLCQSGTAEEISDTRITQPLIFTSDIAIWRILQEQGFSSAAVMAGHSLGEFAALVASNAISFTDGLDLVKARSELMAAAVPQGEGGMAALIGMEDDDVIALCAELTGNRITEAVNFNAPGQVAISGHLDALKKTVEVARERGIRKAIMLAVSVPNHSSLMQSAGLELARLINALDWQLPDVSVVQNATVCAAADVPSMLDVLCKHMYSPVYWTRTIEHFRNDFGVQLVLEVGPGKVLSGLSKRIDRTLPTLPLDTPELMQAALESISALEN